MKTATQPTTKGSIQQAAVMLRQALDTWKAADLGEIANSNTLLESTANHLRSAIAVYGLDPEEQPAELLQIAAGLRRELTKMARVVDACSAFQDGLAVRLGAKGMVYNPSGLAAPSAVSADSNGIEA